MPLKFETESELSDLDSLKIQSDWGSEDENEW